MSNIIADNRFIDDIIWNSGDKCDFKTTGFIHVWQFNTTWLEDISENFYSLLNKQEISRSTKFHFEKDRLSFLISHGVLRLLLGRYSGNHPSILNFEYTVYGKPLLQDIHNLHFNISHSGEYTLIAIAGSETGADIEKINPGFDFIPVLADNYSEVEKAYVNKGTYERFYKLWTRKEALAKLSGEGLNADLQLLPANDGLNVVLIPAYVKRDLVVNSFKIAHNYFCSIAGYKDEAQLRFYEFNQPVYQILTADIFPR